MSARPLFLLTISCSLLFGIFSDLQAYYLTRAYIALELQWENRVYLASYPRSGNHWMRYLIEEATHIATSSVYCDPDPPHLPDIFPWRGYCCDHGYEGTSRYPEEGEPAVVKTHYPNLRKRAFDGLPYTKAIRIIRNPIDAIYSSYVWAQNYSGRIPENIVPSLNVRSHTEGWIRFHKYWDNANNVVTILYEDLYRDPAHYLRIALDAIGYAYTDEDIERAVAKYSPTGGLYKSRGHFTQEDLVYIETKLAPLMTKYGYEAGPR